MSCSVLRRVAPVVLTGALLFAGCSSRPKTAPVRGTVTFNGKAVPNGTITFLPQSGPSASGELAKDGTYTLTTSRKGDGAVPGKYKVIIVAMQDMGDRLPEARSPLPPPIIPEKYSSVATTDLRATVEDQENVLDFKLEGEKPPR